MKWQTGIYVTIAITFGMGKHRCSSHDHKHLGTERTYYLGSSVGFKKKEIEAFLAEKRRIRLH